VARENFATFGVRNSFFMLDGVPFAMTGHALVGKRQQGNVSGSFDSARDFFLVGQTDTRVIAGLDLAETVHKMLEGSQILVIDFFHLVGAEGTAALSKRVLLVGGENNFSHILKISYQ